MTKLGPVSKRLIVILAISSPMILKPYKHAQVKDNDTVAVKLSVPSDGAHRPVRDERKRDTTH